MRKKFPFQLFLSIIFLVFVFLGLVFFFVESNDAKLKPKIIIPYLETPIQNDFLESQKNSLIISKKYKDYDIIITPQAQYKIYACVVSKHSYNSFNIDSYLAPYDVVFSWGKYAKKENYSKIIFWQFNRWYYYYYTSSEYSDISLYSANTHIIPASENIFRAVKK